MNHAYNKLVHDNKELSDWFVVNWCLGNTCNYACSYCPESLHDGSRGWPELDTIKNFITVVKNTHRDKRIYFEFTGGEVTMYRHFIDVCKFCTDQGIKVGFISNGSRTLRYWEENKQYFDHACLSFHPEAADPEHFIEVVKLLHMDLRVHVNIMMSPELFELSHDVANKIVAIGNVSMALQPLIHDFGDVVFDYPPYQQRILDKQHEQVTNRIKYVKVFKHYRGAMRKIYDDPTIIDIAPAHVLISEKSNNWAGWSCGAGVEQLIVDMDGSVYRGWCKVGGRVGNINDHNLRLPTEDIVCNKTMCHCNFDIMSTKTKIN
jgi:sulfatase maturation enzyme AslB (radical SAM superfamily)